MIRRVAKIVHDGMLALVTWLALGVASPARASPPNIVLIYMDDLGYGDLGATGATGYQTPNLDRLAAEGMRFTSFNSVHPVCSASRAAVLTGCYANRVGISMALRPGSETGLNADELTMPEMLRAAGYATAIVGKWHLGERHEFLPLQHGFGEFFGLPYSNDMWRRDYDGTPLAPTGRPNVRLGWPETIPVYSGNEVVRQVRDMEDMAQLTTWYTEKAVEFIGRKHERPFFLYLAHSMPHFPIAVSGRFKGQSRQGLFGDVMMEIDWSVGEVLRAIEQNGLRENTLVIFTSDNGPETTFGEQGGSAGGLRGSKVTTWEGGHRVPCLMRWPAVIPAGRVCNQLAATIDLLPTFAMITGAALPARPIDGVNILSLLQGNLEPAPRKELLYYFRENSLEAVRHEDWKLVFPHPYREITAPGTGGFPGKAEQRQASLALYDLRRDPGETLDVKAANPDIVARLHAIAEQARADLGDDLTNVPNRGRREPGRAIR